MFLAAIPTLCFTQSGNKERLTFFTINLEDSSSTPYKRMMNFLFEKVNSNTSISSKYSLEQRVTSGSFHTAISIDELKKDISNYGIGIVQSDVLYHYLEGNHPQVPTSKKNSDLRAVSKLFPEWLHISLPVTQIDSTKVRLEQGHQVISDFDKIVVNNIGSGSFVTTINVGRILNLKWTNISTIPVDDNSIHFTVQSPEYLDPSPDNIQIGLDEPSARLIASAFPNVYTLVDSLEFTKKHNNVITKGFRRASISVDAILICSQKTPDDVIEFIYKILNDLFNEKGHASTLEGISFPKNTPKANFENLPINRHYWLEEYFTDSLSYFFLEVLSNQVIFYLTVVAIVFLMFRSQLPKATQPLEKSDFTLSFKKRIPVKSLLRLASLVALFLLYHFVIAILIYVSEHHYARDHVATGKLTANGVFGTFRWIFNHLTVGNTTDTVQSNLGMVWVGILQFSYALATSIAAYIAGDRVIKFIKYRKMKEHIVIIGWSAIGNRILEELERMHGLENEKFEFVIIGSQDFKETSISEKFKGSYFKKQDLNDDLKRAQADKAAAAILLSDVHWAKDQNNSDVDLWTINRIHEFNNFIEDTRKKKENEKQHGEENPKPLKKPRVIVEIMNHRNIGIAKRNGASEVICVQFFGLELLAQAAKRPNISAIFNHLLQSSKDSNEIYYRSIPEIVSIKTYPTYSQLIRVLISENHLLKQTPIGIYRDKVDNQDGFILELNPADDFELESQDKIIVLAKKKLWGGLMEIQNSKKMII